MKNFTTNLIFASLTLAAASAVGCIDDSQEPGSAEVDVSAADALGNQVTIGGNRPARLFVPGSYVEGTPTALVIMLHGLSSNGAQEESYLKIRKVAEERGFLYATPDGTQRGWNAGVCCVRGVDDSTYLAGLIEETKSRFTVDPKRVFIVGHSNGAAMAQKMACEHADAVAAVVSLAGSSSSGCAPSEPVAVLEIHGTADRVVPFNGRFFGGARKTLELWGRLNRCDTTLSSGENVSIDARLAGDETAVQFFTNCEEGGHSELWTINGGGHIPPLERDFADQVADFLFAHPKP